MTQYKVVKGKR